MDARYPNLCTIEDGGGLPAHVLAHLRKVRKRFSAISGCELCLDFMKKAVLAYFGEPGSPRFTVVWKFDLTRPGGLCDTWRMWSADEMAGIVNLRKIPFKQKLAASAAAQRAVDDEDKRVLEADRLDRLPEVRDQARRYLRQTRSFPLDPRIAASRRLGARS